MKATMQLKFTPLNYQKDATSAVVAMFKGQPNKPYRYHFDQGIKNNAQGEINYGVEYAYGNGELKSDLDWNSNLEEIQKKFDLPRVDFDGELEFSIDMETGTGKTYTYIKTMFELNQAYGWSKFIVVVPSVAIREGVFKSFQITSQHFLEAYGKRCNFFIYNSQKLQQIADFARGDNLQVMIINSQAFNGADARRIDMVLDEFQSRRPIDVLAKTRPILIIDEPQSVEGKETLKSLKKFNPLFKLKYSATHKKEQIHNLVYRLDAIDAYNQQLVKKIAVKGIHQVGNLAQGGYVFLQEIKISPNQPPEALLEFDCKGKNNTSKKTRRCKVGDDLFELSGELAEYRDGFEIAEISYNQNQIRFLNGKSLSSGEIIGDLNAKQKRRLQIRETILSHLEREQSLFKRGIKVLSLFFIDEVSKYRQYDEQGKEIQGEYAVIFEEEYQALVEEKLKSNDLNQDYRAYLERDRVTAVHNGYFSVDKKTGRVVDSKLDKKEGEGGSKDVDAYDLIMRDKERLLSFAEPTRFIFSHSALKEGWDNPNVFQICTLKDAGKSEIRRRQEVGRGLRLCVNQYGERMDANLLNNEVHKINCLTVIASESYADFAQGLQKEMAETLSNRPQKVDVDFFLNKTLHLADDSTQQINQVLAKKIIISMIKHNYLDEKDRPTDKFYQDKKSNSLDFGEELKEYVPSIAKLLEEINQPLVVENAMDSKRVKLALNQIRFNSQEFKQLWQTICPKTYYQVSFESEELIKLAVSELDKNLKVQPLSFHIEMGELATIESKETLVKGEGFTREKQKDYLIDKVETVGSSERYDLIGALLDATGLTRKTIVAILTGIQPETFAKFQENPEEFILKTAKIINNQKATKVIASLSYEPTGEHFESSLFTEADINGVLGEDTREAKKHLYDYLKWDSQIEKEFSEDLDVESIVDFYIKLPRNFFIDTPMGKYNPDWAVVFKEQDVKHIYFIAETKGSTLEVNLRPVEEAKIKCAKKHFEAISQNTIKYEVVKSWQELRDELKKIMV